VEDQDPGREVTFCSEKDMDTGVEADVPMRKGGEGNNAVEMSIPLKMARGLGSGDAAVAG
jgi:hypothetical protein